MKIVVVSDSFKGCASSREINDLIEEGVRRAIPDSEVVKIPVADGGEGTVDALMSNTGDTRCYFDVRNPMGDPVTAEVGVINDDAAVVEMASASGLVLVTPDVRNPLIANSFGTGQLILHAMDVLYQYQSESRKKLFVGLGGSATNDCGMGMASALGYVFIDKNGNVLAPFPYNMIKVSSIDCSHVSNKLLDCDIIGICDVRNPLYGTQGATVVFGRQKGVTEDTCTLLDDGLKNMSEVIHSQLGKDVADIPGAGASGGLGAGLMAFCNATLQSGIETVLDMSNFDEIIKDADLVITGEGCIDSQSIYGKVPVGVAKRSKKHNVPVLAVVGQMKCSADELKPFGIDAVVSTVGPSVLPEESIAEFGNLIPNVVSRYLSYK